MRRLPSSFYTRDTHLVARELLGKLLVRRWRSRELAARILEVEAYVGEDDRACHASHGLTARTKVMYGEAGHAYVYMIYGMYHCLNIVTEQANFPAAVLIREVAPQFATSAETDGPGKLTREMHITRSLNTEYLAASDKLWLADDGFSVASSRIIRTPRINVAYAGADAKLPWRYLYQPKRLTQSA